MLKFKWTSVFTFDCFYGEGWENCGRFRILKGEIIPYKRYGRTPANYVELATNACKSQKLKPV